MTGDGLEGSTRSRAAVASSTEDTGVAVRGERGAGEGDAVTITVGGRTPEQVERWNENVRESPQGSIFHRYEFLKLMEAWTGQDAYPLVGRAGGEVIGLFPIFRRAKGPVNLVYSPPHGMAVPYLGPALTGGAEASDSRCLAGRFLDAALRWIETNIDPEEYHINTSWRFEDPRPFRRAGFAAVPRYTYSLDLTRGADQLKQSFSRSLRRYLDPDADVATGVPADRVAALTFIVELTRERYEEQGKSYPIDSTLVEEMYERLPEGAVRPYVGSVDGERKSGIVLLRDGDTAYFWSGGGTADADVPLNDLIHWQIIRDSAESELEFYDMVGANTPRICNYKSKFNPELREYYRLTKRSLAAKLYRRLL